MNMTWRQLQEILSQMPSERLDDNVTVLACGEVYPIAEMRTACDENEDVGGVLDEGHAYLAVPD